MKQLADKIQPRRVPFDRRCQLMARLKQKPGRSRRPKKFHYYHAPIRLCAAAAVALVKFAGEAEPRRVCEQHLLDELTDRMHYEIRHGGLLAKAEPSREREIEWFEELRVGGKLLREFSPAIEIADRILMNRAPRERSYDSLETQRRRSIGGDRM